MLTVSLPNQFFKKAIKNYNLTGSILLPADGEGRNGVYAAQQGLKVTAFDTSTEGRKKALLLAEKREVDLDYLVGDLFD